MLELLKKIFRSKKYSETEIEQYLADSISLQDLERRIKQIERGEAPFQHKTTNLLKGWS